METIIIVAAVLISLVIGILVGVVIRKKIAESKINGAEEEAKKLVELAKIEADNLKKEEIFKAKEEIMNARNELDKEIKERRGEIQKQESRIIQKEENLERRAENYERKEENLNRKEKEIEEERVVQNIELSQLPYPSLNEINFTSFGEVTEEYHDELYSYLYSNKTGEVKWIEEYKNGKPVEKTHNLFSGYLLVQMIMTDEAWYVVRNTSGVSGFIGSSGGGAKPFPLQKHELDPILKNMGISTSAIEIDYAVGDEVNVISGPFAGKSGTVESIDFEKETAKVLIDFLGNQTPMEIDLVALEKTF